MQTILAEYDRMEQAQDAVRWLEGQDVSIQDMVIADRSHSAWRNLGHPGPEDRRFVVLMLSDWHASEHARALLASRRTRLMN